MRTDALVFDADALVLAERTRRTLERSGLACDAASSGQALAAKMETAARRGGVWLVRAGAWPLSTQRLPTSSATGRPLLAFGATTEEPAWRELLARGGNQLEASPPRVDSIFVDEPALFARALASADYDVSRACAHLVAGGDVRAVRVPSLDVGWESTLRVVQAITTLHRGGAERVVLDVVSGLRRRGHDVLLAVLDRPSRATFEAPEGTVHLYDLAEGRAARIDALGSIAAVRGADVVHVHLLDGDEVERLAGFGVPVVVTAHNAEPGWPARFTSGARRAALVIGCSREVSRALEAASVGPVRTVWNGIDPTPRAAVRDVARREIGAPADAFVVLSVANLRPQKRLERLPAIVAELRSRSVAAELVVVGEPVKSHEVGALLHAEAERLGIAHAIRLVGSRADARRLVRAADVVVSTSAFEGLSVAHLEALAEGVPLVTTRVPGAAEMGATHPHARVVDVEATPAQFADAILEASTRAGALAPDFDIARAVDRHVELLARAAVSDGRRARGGLVLVTNNFSTGGAQSSARRLLTTLASAGVPVRAIVIEEQHAFPTPGRAALEKAGIVVHVAPRAGRADPLETARAVAVHVDRAAPHAVLFWNVIPEHKILIAELLLGVPVWDVSPGEMYYASFARYFARRRPGAPYLDLRDYARLLAGVIVKYEGEKTTAQAALGTRVEVIANGVDVPARAPLSHRSSRDRIVAGTLARISPDKKLEQLVDAVACAAPRLASFELRIAGGVERGSENYARELRARARGLPIVWSGEQDGASFLRDLDLFAMISEPCGCPNASLEAMAAGLAVVATDAGGAREQIVHGETGLLVPRGASAALGDALVELASDPERRASMGALAHARAVAHFSVERMAADYARVCLGRVLENARAAE